MSRADPPGEGKPARPQKNEKEEERALCGEDIIHLPVTCNPLAKAPHFFHQPLSPRNNEKFTAEATERREAAVHTIARTDFFVYSLLLELKAYLPKPTNRHKMRNSLPHRRIEHGECLADDSHVFLIFRRI